MMESQRPLHHSIHIVDKDLPPNLIPYSKKFCIEEVLMNESKQKT